MQKDKIKAWLENPDRTIEEGKQLYMQNGINQSMMRFYNRVQDPETVMKSLKHELNMLIGGSALPQPKKESKKKLQLIKESAGLVQIPEIDQLTGKEDPFPDAEKRPGELKKIYKKKDQLYVKVRNMHSRVVALGELELTENRIKERQGLAASILKGWDEINKCWKEIDHFKENGKLNQEPAPEPSNLDDADPIELVKKYSNLGTYISKAKKAEDEDRVKELIAERNKIAERLNEITGEDKYKIV